MNITKFPKKRNHIPQCFVINAQGKTLGRLATIASKLLLGKETSFFTPSVNQGNFIIIYNASGVIVTGKKDKNKLYYRNSQRPGSLKVESFSHLRSRIAARVIENAVWGMLPKGILGRQYFRRLYVYSDQKLVQKNKSESIMRDLTSSWAFENVKV